MSTKGLTQKQETFCVKYFELRNVTKAALAAGYSAKYAVSIGSFTLTKPAIQARIKELRGKVEKQVFKNLKDASVMSVLERKQKLSEIGRADVTEFVDKEGNVDVSGGNTGVIEEIQVKDWRGRKDGRVQSRTKKVKIHPKIQAIQELNKMEGIYTEGPQVNIDNRKVEITVVSERARELTEGVVRGDRT